MSKIVYYIKNIGKNIIYGLFPSRVIRYKKLHGRDSDEINSYHFDIFTNYFKCLDVKDIQEYIKDKIVVEIGPGNVLGTAFYALVYGAQKVICVDRFPIADMREQIGHFRKLIDYLPIHLKECANKILTNIDNETENRIVYYSDLIGRFECIGVEKADIILSNAVLEHVYDLPSLLNGILRISKKDALMFHGIDLRSHKMHYKNKLDFLSVNKIMWKLMTCYRGAPNRLSRGHYVEIFERYNYKVLKEIIFEKYNDTVIKEQNAGLSDTKHIKDLEIAVIGFVLKVY